ncbi:putative esterase of the alpha/beta hydrolase fold protein [Hydrogenophaga sp. T4]|nr:putative esterase of the alpha/beta hydrolase fold protein [Hydrogenophaga sp. T4]
MLAGWTAVRFNFRGVGRSEGTYDEGRGELADLLSVIEAQAPSGPLCLAGFSFGAFVTSHAASQLQEQREIRRLVLVGTAASRFEVAPVPAELHPRTLVIHGEQDDTVPLASVMAWARPQVLPVLVVPGGGHFFMGSCPCFGNWSCAICAPEAAALSPFLFQEPDFVASIVFPCFVSVGRCGGVFGVCSGASAA